jgi:hypothetical protein
MEKIIADYVPQESPCPYYPSTGRVECDRDCVSYNFDDEECPELELYTAKKGLLRLKMRQFLALGFAVPSFAGANDFLDQDLFITDW